MHAIAAKIVSYLIFIDFTGETAAVTIKQFTGESGQKIIQENGRNAIIATDRVSGSGQLESSAARVIELFSDIMQVLNRNQTSSVPNQYPWQSPAKFSWKLDQNVGNLNAAANDYSQKRQQTSALLDTGGNNFDRFIVSSDENANSLLDSFVGKFNRRGLDWSNGNLRLVNMQGNRVLGSDVLVHDRSVEIPIKQWLYAFNSLFKPNSNYA